MGWWADLSAKYQDTLERYGTVAVVTYFTLFFGTWGGFWAAMQAGFDVSSTAGAAGTFWGAYAATKLTQPVRIGATLLLTPLVDRGVQMVRGQDATPTPTTPTSTATSSSE